MPRPLEPTVSPVMAELVRATTTEFVPLLTDIAKINEMWKFGHYDSNTAMNKIDDLIGDTVKVMVPLEPEKD